MSRKSKPLADSRLRQVGGGSGVVVVRDNFTVLIALDDSMRAHEVWTAIGEHGTVDSVIDVLARDGIGAMPDVVLAVGDGDQLTIIVRGDVQVDVALDSSDQSSSDDSFADGDSTTGGSHRQLDGKNVRSWTETSIDGWSSCSLKLAGVASKSRAVNAPSIETFVASGVVAGGSVCWIRSDHAVPGDAPPAGIGEPDTPAEGPLAAPAETPSDSSALTPSTDQATTITPGEAIAVGDGVDRIVDQPIDESPLEDGADDPYADMFGRTVYRDVQAAAVPAADEASPREPDVADERPDGRRDDGPGLIDSNDTRSLAEYEARRVESPPIIEVAGGSADNSAAAGQGDHDGHTMSLAELRRLRAQSGAPAEPVARTTPDVSGPTVQAVLCGSGHPNPAYANQCRQCGQPVGGATVVVARPTLGRLQASTGDVVELDRPVIVGRNPSLTGRRLSEIPHEWRITKGDGLSRNHAMFHIDGWQVRVEDLGSVNSTTVTLPGREPEMLRAGEPVLITDGAVIDLGGEVTCRYDASA